MSSSWKCNSPIRADLRYASPRPPSRRAVPRPITRLEVRHGVRQLVTYYDLPRTGSLKTQLSSRAIGAPSGWRARRVMVQTRPRSKRAATAPSGTTPLQAFPEPPRRAISARPTSHLPGQGPRKTYERQRSLKVPRVSVYDTPESRSVINKRKSSNELPNKSRANPAENKRRAMPLVTLEKCEEVADGLEQRPQGNSLSQKPRVRETLQEKQMDYLTTDLGFKDGALPTTPLSMLSTPREMYGAPPEQFHSPEPRDIPDRTPSPRPHPTMWPMVADVKSKGKARNIDSAPPADARLHPIPEKHEITLRSGAVLSIVSPESTAWKHQVYVPGPIRLTKEAAMAPAISRKNSAFGNVATLEPFVGEIEGTEEPERRASDDAAAEGVVTYFEDLVIADCAADVLDRYWVEPVAKRKESSNLSIPTRPQPRTRALPSASSPLLPSPGLHMRGNKSKTPTRPQQRIKLRRLLQSAGSIV